MPSHRTNAGAWSAEIAAQQQEIGDLSDRGYGMPMLRDAHRPGAHGATGIEIDLRGLFELGSRQSGLIFNLIPTRCRDAGTILCEFDRVLRQELAIQQRGTTGGQGGIVRSQYGLAHPAHGGHVSAETHLVIMTRNLGASAAEHLQLVLRVGEALESALTNRVEHHYLGATLRGFAQVAEHPWVIGARILAQHEDGIRLLEVLELHGALAYADALAKSHPARLVAHIRAVREVVRAIKSHKQLVQECRLVAGATGRIELGAVRAVEPSKNGADFGKGLRPVQGEITIACGIVPQRLRQAALMLQFVIRPAAQLADRVLREKCQRRALVRGFPRNGFDTVLAEFERRAVLRIAPCAARAVEAVRLVRFQHRARAGDRLASGQQALSAALEGSPAAGGRGGLSKECRLRHRRAWRSHGNCRRDLDMH